MRHVGLERRPRFQRANLGFLLLEAVAAVEGVANEQTTLDDAIRLKSGPWVRLCDLGDRSYIAIELGLTYKYGWKVVRVRPAATEVCPVIAWSL